MIKKITTNEGIQYKKLTPEEMKAKGILGRLIGPCADFINPTRNGRGYSEQLWENVFNNPIMQEKIKNGVCFGELGHPVDRTEIDMEKIAICLREQPVKNEKGQLCAVFDILDTPNGRILKTLCDYGSTVGVSSRGQGDLITDANGNECVDPDTYECECWDVVLIPAVETARMKYVTEGLDTNKLKMKKALCESLDKATEEEKKIMKETLENLNINLVEEKEEEVKEEKVEDEKVEEAPVEENSTDDKIEQVEETSEIENNSNSEETENKDEEAASNAVSEIDIFTNFLVNNFNSDQVKDVCKILDIDLGLDDEIEESEPEDTKEETKQEDNKEEIPEDTNEEETNEESTEVEEAIDNGTEVLVKSLQEALTEKSNLESNYKQLQEKLAVSDTKVGELTEECDKYKQAVVRLSEMAKSNKDLKANVSKLEESLNEKNEMIKSQQERIARLVKSRKDQVNESNNLTESVNSKVSEINSLNESLNNVKIESENKINALKEELAQKEVNSQKKINELNESLTKAQSIKESYKKLANNAVNKYIDIKATMLGLTSIDIKRKLGESYTLADVDAVCEDLKSYQLNVSKLPFSIDRKVGIRVNESNIKKQINSNAKFNDDDVDDSLLRLARFDN